MHLRVRVRQVLSEVCRSFAESGKKASKNQK